MPPPARFVARRCIDPALKGPNRKAQGNALGIEGDLYESALKGRHRTCSAPSGRSRKRRVGTVPSLVPRALPGAFLFGPFRARNAEAVREGPAGASDPVKTNVSSTQAGGLRMALQRSRERFVEFLLQEVAGSLNAPTPDRLEQELIDLRLLDYLRPALKRAGRMPTTG